VLPKLPRLPSTAVIAALERLGFQVVRQKGSHVVLRRILENSKGSHTTFTCVVPMHHRDLAVGTLASVLRQAGIDNQTFLNAL
jgi:predicted RNA binding protein YcfA (HicA-like mRNA interferase family)